MSERILLVEDSKTQAAFVTAALAGAGYAYELVETGEAALESIRRSPPAMVILDVRLPGISGMEVCRILRGDPSTHQLPILMFTDQESSPAELLGLQQGADDYVGKSEPLENLLARVKRLLERHRDYQRVSEKDRLQLLKSASDVLSHGINNPLQVILMSLEVLQERASLDERGLRALGNIRRYVSRLSRLVKNIEAVSRVAENAYVERSVLLDLRRALVEAEEQARADAEFKI